MSFLLLTVRNKDCTQIFLLPGDGQGMVGGLYKTVIVIDFEVISILEPTYPHGQWGIMICIAAKSGRAAGLSLVISRAGDDARALFYHQASRGALVAQFIGSVAQINSGIHEGRFPVKK